MTSFGPAAVRVLDAEVGQEGVLVGESGIESPHRHAGPPGNLAHGQTRHFALADDLLGGGHQTPHRPPAPLLLGLGDAGRRPPSPHAELQDESSMNMNLNSCLLVMPV